MEGSFLAPNLTKPILQDRRKSLYDFRCNEARRVQIVNMNAVDIPVTGELHADQIRDRNYGNSCAMHSSVLGSHGGVREPLLRPDFLTREH